MQLPVSEWEAQEQHLLEMFPKCSVSEARSALSIAKGDMEEAVRLIIEGDVQLNPTPNVRLPLNPPLCVKNTTKICYFFPLKVNQGKGISHLPDQKLKESILEK